jgi:hypothetical protein
LIRFAADEDLDNHIVRALRHHVATVDIVSVREEQLASAKDDRILQWAAESNRVLLSHDASTMTAAAYSRIGRGQHFCGPHRHRSRNVGDPASHQVNFVFTRRRSGKSSDAVDDSALLDVENSALD